MAFDGIISDPGSGGSTFAMDTFTDTDAVVKTMPYTAFAFGSLDGPYTVVTATSGLPVSAPVGTPVFVRLSDGAAAISTLPVSLASVPAHDVTNGGTFAVQAAQSGTWTVQPGNTANTTAWLVTGTGGTFPATQSGTWNVATVTTVTAVTSLTQFNGNAIDTNSGNKSAGTLRVVLATDQPQLTNKLLVTPDANSAVNVAQINGVTVLMGNGASGTGAQRVTIANDSTGILAGVTTVTTVTTVSTVTTLANGQTAHDGAATGSPLRIGAKAETALSGVTLVADGDATDLFAGVDGVLIVRPHSNLEDVVQERTTNTDGASTAFASGLAAPGSGIRLWIKNVTICNSSATFCTVDLRDGSAGSVLWTLPVPATGGVTHNFDPPLRLTANTALAFDASAATTTLTISANGFKSKV